MGWVQKRMNISIAASGETVKAACGKILREVKGKRQVYDGLLNAEPVIIKLFANGIRGWKNFHKEKMALTKLAKTALLSPSVRVYGKVRQGYAIVTEKIVDAVTVLEKYQKAKSKSEKLAVALLFIKHVADQHNKGVLQRDLHMGNFLIKGEQVYAIDPARMVFDSKPIAKNKGLKQIAAVIAILDSDMKNDLLSEYAKCRKIDVSQADKKLIEKEIKRTKIKGTKRGLKKFSRKNRRHLKIKTKNAIAMFDVKMAAKEQVQRLIENVDEMMAKGEILKNGRTCYVSKIKLNGKMIVVKRYNNKGFWHSVRHSIKGARAKRCWLMGLRLWMLKIKTPMPVGFIEIKHSGLIKNSYIITEFVEAENFATLLNDENAEIAAEKIVNKLDQWKITHGDLKPSNILIVKNNADSKMEAVLTDLDSMVCHKTKLIYNYYRKKDLRRFKGTSNNFG